MLSCDGVIMRSIGNPFRSEYFSYRARACYESEWEAICSTGGLCLEVDYKSIHMPEAVGGIEDLNGFRGKVSPCDILGVKFPE